MVSAVAGVSPLLQRLFFFMTPSERSCCSEQPSAPSPPRRVEAPEAEGPSWRSYIPLFALIFVALLAAVAKQVHYGSWGLQSAMLDFMGLFLLSFSMLKLFDLKGFAAGFQKYDLLASRLPGYALLYPFVSLLSLWGTWRIGLPPFFLERPFCSWDLELSGFFEL